MPSIGSEEFSCVSMDGCCPGGNADVVVEVEVEPSVLGEPAFHS